MQIILHVVKLITNPIYQIYSRLIGREESTLALPMFPRSRKFSKYSTASHGTTCRSILRINFLSLIASGAESPSSETEDTTIFSWLRFFDVL